MGMEVMTEDYEKKLGLRRRAIEVPMRPMRQTFKPPIKRQSNF